MLRRPATQLPPTGAAQPADITAPEWPRTYIVAVGPNQTDSSWVGVVAAPLVERRLSTAIIPTTDSSSKSDQRESQIQTGLSDRWRSELAERGATGAGAH